jgi:hypothetical protein
VGELPLEIRSVTDPWCWNITRRRENVTCRSLHLSNVCSQFNIDDWSILYEEEIVSDYGFSCILQ